MLTCPRKDIYWHGHLQLSLMQALILGRDLDGEKDKDLVPYLQSGQIVRKPPGTPWRDFLKLIQSAKSLFVPNIHDASPRYSSANTLS